MKFLHPIKVQCERWQYVGVIWFVLVGAVEFMYSLLFNGSKTFSC